MIKNTRSAAAIFRSALRRKQSNHPQYSLRAIARDLGVSPAFVSKMMSGKKPPPRERLEKLCYVLELDVLERESVVCTVMLDKFAAKVLMRPPRKRKKGNPRRRKTSEASSRTILSSWMNLAVMEGLTLSAPHNDPEQLRERLGLTALELQRTITTLFEAGLIEPTAAGWIKKDELLYIAGGRSRAEVRAFHEKMIAKARTELVGKTAQADFERRLINGFTLAVNSDHLERLKRKIIQFMDELCREAGEGDCQDVYQCNVQFFPLTRELNEK